MKLDSPRQRKKLPLIEVARLAFTYPGGDTPALRRVDLSIAEGECAASAVLRALSACVEVWRWAAVSLRRHMPNLAQFR